MLRQFLCIFKMQIDIYEVVDSGRYTLKCFNKRPDALKYAIEEETTDIYKQIDYKIDSYVDINAIDEFFQILYDYMSLVSEIDKINENNYDYYHALWSTKKRNLQNSYLRRKNTNGFNKKDLYDCFLRILLQKVEVGNYFTGHRL